MVDYDGADIIETYLNGLNWSGAGLVEPAYYEYHEREDAVNPNVVIIQQTTIATGRSAQGEYYFNHSVNLQFTHTTKALAFGNLKFIVKNLLNYTTTDNIVITTTTMPVQYLNKRKIFNLNVEVLELISL